MYKIFDTNLIHVQTRQISIRLRMYSFLIYRHPIKRPWVQIISHMSQANIFLSQHKEVKEPNLLNNCSLST